MSRYARVWAVVTLAWIGATTTAVAQVGRVCERGDADELCWRCADADEPYNRLCTAPVPCAEGQLCIRYESDLTTPVCLDPVEICCDAACDRPPGCEGVTSSCDGSFLRCAFYGACRDLPTPDAGTMRDAAVVPADAGPGPRDAGPEPRDAGATGFDAAAPDEGFDYRGGGGCACRLTPGPGSSSAASLALLLLLLPARRRR